MAGDGLGKAKTEKMDARENSRTNNTTNQFGHDLHFNCANTTDSGTRYATGDGRWPPPSNTDKEILLRFERSAAPRNAKFKFQLFRSSRP